MRINIGKLKAGMVVKNYKEMTSLLGVSYNRNMKNRVLKAIEDYVIYEQVGNAFHIKKVRGININSDKTEVLIKHPICDLLFVDSEERNKPKNHIATAAEMEEKFPFIEYELH